jgi:hypothetical protein
VKKSLRSSHQRRREESFFAIFLQLIDSKALSCT